MLCNSPDKKDNDNDDLFQMILDLAKIFLCANDDSTQK